MNCLRISLFGKFCVTAPNQTPILLEPTKVQELFFYLLLYAHRPHTREKLAELLWQDSSATQSRKYLRHTLWQLQSTLDETVIGHELLNTDSDWIQVNPQATYWLDTQEFESAYTQSQDVDGPVLTAAAAQALMDAVVLYRGDLLENWYQDWCLFERERLQNQFLTMLHKLMVYCECTQQYEAGIMYGMKMLECDQAREQTHRRLMRLYCLAGDRTRALRQYERCVDILQKELGVRPARRTLNLVQQIRNGAPLEKHAQNNQTDISKLVASPSSDLLTQLHQLKEILILTQSQVDSNIDILQNQPLNGSSLDPS